MRLLGILLIAFHAVEADELIVAGGKEVFIVDGAKAEAGVIEKIWRWSGEDAADLPEEARKEFRHMDECKPMDNGAKILVCASNGGCALIDRATKRILWRAWARNAHSLALLPQDRIVVASSLGGDHLEVFEMKGAATPVFKTPLRSAHGVVWDEQRRCLWALGFDELRAYTLENWGSAQPSLKLKAAHKLPDEDGHDLRPVPRSDDLILTTGNGVYLFNRDTAVFQKHALLGAEANMKSADIHPVSGRIVLSQWKPVVRLLQPAGRIDFKDAQPYKARWFPGVTAR
jgi:hypothetical protein